jgi:prepilin-type N-terminal cleavage/methylation domain-containing protein
MLSRKDPADAGFTLIEVLAALAVIGLVLSATLNTLTTRAMFVGATVKITWTSRDCANNLCSYSAATRLSLTSATAGEPQFGSS